MVISIPGEKVLSLSIEEVVEIVEAAFKGFLDPGVEQPPRSELLIEGGRRFLGVMPTYIREYNVFTVKVIDYPFDGRRFEAAVLVYDLSESRFLAVVDGVSVTTLRTAGMGLVSSIHLASKPRSIALVGAGVQGSAMLKMHIKYFDGVEKVSIVSRTRGKAEALAKELSSEVDAEVYDDVDSAVSDVDIVILATTSSTPVLDGDEVPDGSHVISIGYMGRDSREFGEMLLKRASKVFLDGPDALEAGDIRIPLEKGVVNGDKIRLMSELLLGRAPGRESADEITLFKSVGTAVQDGYMAYNVWRRLAMD